MSLEFHQNSDQDLEKGHLIGLDLIPLVVFPLFGKTLFLSLYTVLLSPDIVPTMGIVPEQLF